jgi:hypothetical protein
MLLLASVTMLIVAIAGAAALLEPVPAAVKKPIYLSERAMQLAPPPDLEPVYLANQIPARVIGTPFVPNTHPRER